MHPEIPLLAALLSDLEPFYLCILIKGIPWIPLKIPLSIFQPRIPLEV